MNKRQKEVIQYNLDSEKAVLNDLKKQYAKALADIGEKIKILQADELTQSRIYQLQYQKALKKQVEAILEKLHADEYSTIQQYLSGSYTNSFVGVMYDIAGQGIPIIAPIDQQAAVEAIITDSKISEGLYTSLGVDTAKLKKNIRSEITRGIAAGQDYAQISRNLSNASSFALSRAKTIVRTEGHRIQQASADDARQTAKSKGADVVKQWDATLDGATRSTHRELDGQIREVDEYFQANGKQAKYPGDFGDPAEDCNCRCEALTRARAAINADELAVLKERAEYFGLDKTKDFKDFKEKYLKAVENERIAKSAEFSVDFKRIESRGYADKFDAMASDKQERREFLKAAKEMLHHRSGQNGEDLYLYNKVKKTWVKSVKGQEPSMPEYTDAIRTAIKNAKNGELVSFHNHPASMPPSVGDLNAALYNGYSVGYAICHDGTIFEYTAPKNYIRPTLYDFAIAKYKREGYNEYDAQVKALQSLTDEYGFAFKEVK